MDYALVGQIINTHGIKGEVKVRVLMDQVDDFISFESYHLFHDAEGKRPVEDPGMLRIEKARPHKLDLIVSFQSIEDLDQAEAYKGLFLAVPAGKLPQLAEGRYYRRDIVGLKVEDLRGRRLGRIEDIIETGAHDVYVVKKDPLDPGELLIPNIEELVKEIDLEEGKMTVQLMDGLLEASDYEI